MYFQAPFPSFPAETTRSKPVRAKATAAREMGVVRPSISAYVWLSNGSSNVLYPNEVFNTSAPKLSAISAPRIQCNSSKGVSEDTFSVLNKAYWALGAVPTCTASKSGAMVLKTMVPWKLSSKTESSF